MFRLVAGIRTRTGQCFSVDGLSLIDDGDAIPSIRPRSLADS
jgi:hypothetical protein